MADLKLITLEEIFCKKKTNYKIEGLSVVATSHFLRHWLLRPRKGQVERNPAAQHR